MTKTSHKFENGGEAIDVQYRWSACLLHALLDCSLDWPCDLGAIHTYASRMHALQRLGIQEEDLLVVMRGILCSGSKETDYIQGTRNSRSKIKFAIS